MSRPRLTPPGVTRVQTNPAARQNSLDSAELVAIATAAGCTGIRLKCASSADSNEFWRAAGFQCTRVTAGGVKRGRDINWYRTEIQPGLFTFAEVPASERPIDLTEYQRLKRAAVKMPSRFSRSHY